MAVPNIISGTVSISDYLLKFLVAPKFFSIPLTLSPINKTQTSEDLIKKILHLIIFWLTRIILSIHQIQSLKNPKNVSIKI